MKTQENTARQTIMVHDYAGHPFTAELSRELARNGYIVHHVFFAGDKGPKGKNLHEAHDPDLLSFHAIDIDRDYSKTNLFARRSCDIEYGNKIATLIEELRPDIVLSGNTPTETQEPILRATKKHAAKFIFWCQDFYSIAAKEILSKKIPVLGAMIGNYYTHLEKRQMRNSDHIVHITEAFRQQTDEWGIPAENVSVIPNWAAISAISVRDRENSWSAAQQLSAGRRIIYSGTLALKHNPRLLMALAKSIDPPDELIVIANGVGMEWLREQKLGKPTLRCLSLQPIEVFEDVLASSDVLVAVIEEDAGRFSVPSKVLSYLCAGRPIVLAAPADNLAAKIVAETGAGLISEPADINAFVQSVQSYLKNPEDRRASGLAGRIYAEETFQIDSVARSFDSIFSKILEKSVM
ncbi:MAG: glycosyltransferase family 4 protein [Sulfitobacter sp.]|uniref:glycosyltransferase family 4 protein n=2 Tax=Sulfitobacter sp. TaxID=1903071 RepID=UPI003298E15F